MLNILGSLEASKRSMEAQLKSIITTSHNISNANTKGYSRQEVLITEAEPNRIAEGWIGNGSKVGEIRRAYDEFSNFQIYNETGDLGNWDVKKSTLEEVENLFNDVSGSGLNELFGSFWNSWQDLINNPESSTPRTNLKEWALTLVDRFNDLSSKLDSISINLDNTLISDVDRVNQLANQIADINGQIKSMNAYGDANDLMDELDLKIEELSAYGDVKVDRLEDSTIRVTFANNLLVDGTFTVELGTQDIVGSQYHEVIWSNTGTLPDISSGKIKGLVDSRDTIVTYYKDKLNTLASELITQVNTLHRQGMGLDGTSEIEGANEFTGAFTANGSFELNGVTINVNAGDDLDDLAASINAETANTGVVASNVGNKLVLEPDAVNPQTIKINSDPDDIMLTLGIVNNFFAGTDADDIAVDDVILNDTNKIAASVSGAPGDANNAMSIYNLKDQLLMDSGKSTFNDFYANFVGVLANDTREATNYTDMQNTVLEQLKSHKQSIVGVSLDEELANLVLYQNAYQAAAKVMGVIDDLLNSLINTMGR
ncbi:flagellar hook-associated protein FlgK [Candidatus Poribacteria bacterium]|nr:flagellar hook-associated protein FlgK [Candidatus Poribacteria bacterium]